MCRWSSDAYTNLEIACSSIVPDELFEIAAWICCFMILERRRMGKVLERSMRATAASWPWMGISL